MKERVGQKTALPICKIGDKTYVYDVCLTQKDDDYLETHVYLGVGNLYKVKNIPQTDSRTLHFYRRIR